MKRLFILLVMCFCIINVKAENQSIYCELIGTKLFSTTDEFTVYVDFGQYQKIIFPKVLKSDDGKTMKFHSMIDAMNWMDKKGWNLEQTYVTGSGNSLMYHWVLSKRIDENDVIIKEIDAYLKQKADEAEQLAKAIAEQEAKEEQKKLELLGIEETDSTLSVSQQIDERTNELKKLAQKETNRCYIAWILMSGQLDPEIYGLLITFFSMNDIQGLMGKYSLEELESLGKKHDIYFEKFKRE
ncbi:MAG: hypothetical protein IKN59_09010 [Paludibacteraceae bacterium]|nr:hypothetical protein [Paludibacteraceae bacterium]